jgi:hypothetical protein
MSTLRRAFPRCASGLLLAFSLLLLPVRLDAAPCEAFRFAPPRDLAPLPPGGGIAAVVDLTGDARPDILVLAYDGSAVVGAVQSPDGTFEALAPLSTPAFGILTGDFDGDGREDAVLLRGDGPTRLRVRDGVLEAGPPVSSVGTFGSSYPVAVADLDRDGRSEVLVNTGSTLDAYREDATGAFRRSVVASLRLGKGWGLSLVVGDFDGDGDDDVVATAENYPTFEPNPVLWGDGHGGLAPGTPVSFNQIESSAVADFDGDGREEFVYAAYGMTATSHYWTAGLTRWDGSAGLRSTYLDLLSSPSRLLAADFDRDGHPDLVVSYYGGGTLYRGLGAAFERVGPLAGFTPTAAADLDGDGLPDLVGSTETAIRVARNVCVTTLPDATVPVVVSTSGASGVRFETELTIDSLADAPLDLDVRYTPSFGGGAGTATFHLEAGGQLFFASILDALADAGVPLPREGDRGGPLAIQVRGGSAESIAATTRVLAVGSGRGGVSFAEQRLGAGLGPLAVVGWLRETGGDRSNLAVVNLGGESKGDLVLRVTLVPDVPGGWTSVLPEVRLAPGSIHQWNRVLRDAGMTGGWALVQRVSGTAPFFAYGVVNDEGTGDGSFVAGFESDRAASRSWVVPAIVESGRYSSDLVLTNATGKTRTLSFRFVSETLTTDDRTARFQLEVPPFGQLYLPGLVAELRRRGVAGIPAAGGEVVGALFAEIVGEPSAGLFLGARTSAGKPEGRYGVFYEAVPAEAPARSSALVPAVRQDGSVRTNVAIVNLEDRERTFDLFARDPANGGRSTGEVRTLTIGPFRWVQVGAVLDALGTGLFRATVRVVSKSGAVRFLAYGVTNEGARPGEASDDGTYVPGR